MVAVAAILSDLHPDIVLLQGIDYDLDLAALTALRNAVAEAGQSYPHIFALRPNTGMATGADLDADGRTGEPEDAQGYGDFAGEGGMALLSRHPIARDAVRDLSDVLWRDVPGALLSDDASQPLFTAPILANLRLATVGQWIVPVDTPLGRVDLMALHAGTPVFDGPEDHNGRRNHDQLMFWLHVLNGAFGPPPSEDFVLLGATNQDPTLGEGRKAAIRALLDDPRLQDPKPARPDPATGPARHHTVNWPDPGPGTMRVDYILPSRGWQVVASGVHWPAEGTAADQADTASRHRLVWVDLGR